MAQTIKNVILIGGSGNIGSCILTSLIAATKFHISILTRAESQSSYPASIPVFKSDYSVSSLAEAFQGQDAVICALGHAGWADEIKMIDAAVLAGVKRFVPSEYGSNTLNAKVRELFAPALDVKVQVLEYLKEQEGKGLSWTGISTGAFFDWGLQMGLFGFNINTHTAVIFDGGNQPFSVTNLSQVANAVVAVLLKPEETANQYLYVHSFTVTQNQILAALEEATSTKWDVTESTTDAAVKEGKERLSKGDFGGMMLLLNANFLGQGYGADFTKDVELANEKLGLPSEELEETCKFL